MSGCCLSVFLSLFPLCVSVSPPFHLSVTFSFSSLPLIHLQLFILVSLSHLSVCLSVHLPVSLIVYLPVSPCQPAFLSISLPAFLPSLHLSICMLLHPPAFIHLPSLIIIAPYLLHIFLSTSYPYVSSHLPSNLPAHLPIYLLAKDYSTLNTGHLAVPTTVHTSKQRL